MYPMTKFFLTVFLIGCTTLGWSQTTSQKKLEKRKAQILKEIQALNSKIASKDKKEKTVLNDIADSEAKIKLSERLIHTTNRQTKLITEDIYTNQLKINALNGELQILKEDYANMLVQAYKNRSEQSRIMFILSSGSFLEAYKRMRYMEQYASFRKVQGNEIRGKMLLLGELTESLSLKKAEKEKLLAESEEQKEELEKEKTTQEKLVQSIQRDKKQYAADIKKKQKEARAIDGKIEAMIRQAIAEANRKEAAKRAAKEKAAKEKAALAAKAKTSTAKGTASKTTKTTTKKEVATAAPAKEKAAPVSYTKIELSTEDKALAGSFKANKGQMPAPVNSGFVSSRFGNQASHTVKDAVVNNHGIDITAEPGTAVKAVFKGEVLLIQIIAGTKAVTIRHGDFMTIYYNLENIAVSVGDKVTTGQRLGTIHTTPSGKTILKFDVLQNNTFLNPQSWIRL